MIRNIALIFAGLLAVACAPILTIAAQGAPAVGTVGLVVSNPWNQSAQSIVALSNLQEIGPIQGMYGALVLIETNESIQSLYENGAWFVLDGQKILELCVS